MFNRNPNFGFEPGQPLAGRFSPVMMEGLEDRQLLSGGVHHLAVKSSAKKSVSSSLIKKASLKNSNSVKSANNAAGRHGRNSTILFSQAPAAVQSGLNSLTNTTVDSSQSVKLGNRNGVETYSITLSSTGTDTLYTVDVSGNAVTAPTVTDSTFGAVTDTDVTAELSAIATALNLTAPVSSDPVVIVTPSTGNVTYGILLTSTSSRHGQFVTVDSDGVPVGNEQVPLSTLPTTIQNGLTSNAPAGATALTAASKVAVRTLNGVTTYSAVYAGTGTRTTVTVNAAGILANLPSNTTVNYSTIPSAAKTSLQSLATTAGYIGTIPDTQSVNAYDEANGTTIYTVTLAVTDSSGTTTTRNVSISVDQIGNPTVSPRGGGEGGCHGHGGFGFGDILGVGRGLDMQDLNDSIGGFGGFGRHGHGGR